MTLKTDTKFKGKLTCDLKNDLRNLEYELKITGELCLMTLKSDAKFEEKLILGSKNDMMNLVNFNASRWQV